MSHVVNFISEWWIAGLAFVLGWAACTATYHYFWWKERKAEAEEWANQPKPNVRPIEYAEGIQVLADSDAQKRLELAIFRSTEGDRPRSIDECIKAAAELRDFRDDMRGSLRALARESRAI